LKFCAHHEMFILTR